MATFDSGGQEETIQDINANGEQHEDQTQQQEAWEATASAPEQSDPPQTASEKPPATSLTLSISSSAQQATSNNPDSIQPDHMPPLKSKCIFVFRNGDTHFPAKRFTINRKEVLLPFSNF